MIHVDKKIDCFVTYSSGAEHKVYLYSLRAWAAQASLSSADGCSSLFGVMLGSARSFGSNPKTVNFLFSLRLSPCLEQRQ